MLIIMLGVWFRDRDDGEDARETGGERMLEERGMWAPDGLVLDGRVAERTLEERLGFCVSLERSRLWSCGMFNKCESCAQPSRRGWEERCACL